MLKVFEAFAGYGSQRMALRNIGIKFEVVGISEIDGDVLQSYAAIHTDFLEKRKNIDEYVPLKKEEMISYLEKINVPLNYKTFENRAGKLKLPQLKDMYLANKLIKNYGDIQLINPASLPDFDLFTYSFPCQDISVAGYQQGLNESSGTRSSLLWECCKIIETKKPKYLMMENVKNLVGCNHKENFLKFLEYLESLGYKNSWSILNAREYGTPQNRERVFCISELNATEEFEFPEPVELKTKLYDLLEHDVSDKFYLRNGQVMDEPIRQEYSYCLDSNYWKGVTLHSFLEKHRRQLVTDKIDENGKYVPRRLTPKETWRLMGVSDTDFEKASQLISQTSLYKQSGNSIVVSVLEAIFSKLFPEPENISGVDEQTDRAEKIMAVRKKLGITRKEFSDALYFDKEQEKLLKEWETGKTEIPDYIYNKIMKFPTEPPFKNKPLEKCRFKQIDLFAGIGGIRQAFQNQGGYTVYSSELDKFAQTTYRINYGEVPDGDITVVDENTIPDHDILLGGFPCQPFSQAGLHKGFDDARGTLFFDIARILKAKRPKAFMLENVKQLKGHDKGKTLKVILSVLEELNYYVPEPQILNAYHFGIPQNRERIIIVGFNKDYLPENYAEFKYPKGKVDESVCVGNILENVVNDRFTISDKLYAGHIARKKMHESKGNGFGFCLFNKDSKYTSTISARYYKDGSEALIEQNGKNPRMLTPRECARLQGFPDEFIIPVSNARSYKQFGNAVCIPVIEAVAKEMLNYLGQYKIL